MEVTEMNPLTTNNDKILEIFLKAIEPITKMLAIQIPFYSKLDHIGLMQFVLWKEPPTNIKEEIVNSKKDEEISKAIIKWLEHDNEKEIREMIKRLSEDSTVRMHPLYKDVVDCYKEGRYNIAAVGITAIIDKLLAEVSDKITQSSLEDRVKKLKAEITEKEIQRIGDDGFEKLILTTTYFRSIKAFSKSRAFNSPKGEPKKLSRDWIMHGRSMRIMTKVDCIRMFQMACGTILISEFADRPRIPELGMGFND